MAGWAGPCNIPGMAKIWCRCDRKLLLGGATLRLGPTLWQRAAAAGHAPLPLLSPPCSLHFVNLNMMTVDVDEESMDALMQQLLGDSPLAPTLAPSPTTRLTPRGASGGTQGQPCPNSASRSLFKGLGEPQLEGCDGQGTAQAEQGSALLRGGGGKGLARAQAMRR